MLNKQTCINVINSVGLVHGIAFKSGHMHAYTNSDKRTKTDAKSGQQTSA